ncbi:MAG TPA: DUF559 domain-containing protein [Plantibacter sp.]|uniref:endonuclease domain-containing protein n=1 Tax=Plantibacter sp. TaxID=1871045 RepID=UPI002B9E715E|nr:DUF559 domain-containing protein [Plantibacter sp.]
MDLTAWIDERNGIAHRLYAIDAIDAGATRNSIEQAVRARQLRVIRRNWLRTEACDPQLLMAATRGGRLSCLTVAGRRGWWNISDGFVHLSVAPTASAAAESGVRLHWSATPSPVSTRTLVQPPVNALVHIAECQPFERALAVFESAIRIGHADLARLRLMPLRSRRFRQVVDRASELSDSGIESLPRVRLARIGIHMQQQVILDGHRVDGLIGERLVLQFDGHSPHQDAAQRNRDLAQDRRLLLAGWTVLRFSYRQIMHDWALVEREITDAVAQGRHR